MKVLVLGSGEVSSLLSLQECMKVMEETFRAMARGEATFPPRQAVPIPEGKGALGLMPGLLSHRGVTGLKATTVFPGNVNTAYESHQGAVLIFETDHGRPLAIVDAGSITRIRTAAVSAVATNALARKDIDELAILGSGTQAASHLEAMLIARPDIGRVRVYSRTRSKTEAFAKRASSAHGVSVQAAESARDAVRGAGLICTTTASISPVLLGAWLEPGMHINAIGASRPPARELDSEAVSKGLLFVDSRQSAMAESDDFRVPRSEGLIDDSHIRGELGEVLEGKVRGRSGPDDITIFKSLGLAIEDLAAAHYAYSRAKSERKGTLLEFGAERDG